MSPNLSIVDSGPCTKKHALRHLKRAARILNPESRPTLSTQAGRFTVSSPTVLLNPVPQSAIANPSPSSRVRRASHLAPPCALQPLPWVNPAPQTLHPTPFALHPAPYNPHPPPCTFQPCPYTLHPTPYTLHPAPYTLHPTPYTLHPTPYTLHPTPYTLHPTPYTLHPTSSAGEAGRHRVPRTIYEVARSAPGSLDSIPVSLHTTHYSPTPDFASQ